MPLLSPALWREVDPGLLVLESGASRDEENLRSFKRKLKPGATEEEKGNTDGQTGGKRGKWTDAEKRWK